MGRCLRLPKDIACSVLLFAAEPGVPFQSPFTYVALSATETQPKQKSCFRFPRRSSRVRRQDIHSHSRMPGSSRSPKKCIAFDVGFVQSLFSILLMHLHGIYCVLLANKEPFGRGLITLIDCLCCLSQMLEISPRYTSKFPESQTSMQTTTIIINQQDLDLFSRSSLEIPGNQWGWACHVEPRCLMRRDTRSLPTYYYYLLHSIVSASSSR